MSSNPNQWMWAEAIALLDRAERLNRTFFQPSGIAGAHPNWEPPADIFETERELRIILALPGIPPNQVQLFIDGGCLVVAGVRSLPAEGRAARVHRLEIPQGRFHRRLPLPAGQFELTRNEFAHGCLLIILTKIQ